MSTVKSELDRLNEHVLKTKPNGRVAYTTVKVRAHVHALMLRSKFQSTQGRLYEICGLKR